MVPKGGFEPPRGSPTTPSRWRVYQFHHFGIELLSKKSRSGAAVRQYCEVTVQTAAQQHYDTATLLYFFGSGRGAWGNRGAFWGSAGTVWAGLSLITEEAFRDEAKASSSDVIIKMIAATVVSFVRNPIAPELPKIVWLAPPKAAPISAPLPA
jgi:hypothetical protein